MLWRVLKKLSRLLLVLIERGEEEKSYCCLQVSCLLFKVLFDWLSFIHLQADSSEPDESFFFILISIFLKNRFKILFTSSGSSVFFCRTGEKNKKTTCSEWVIASLSVAIVWFIFFFFRFGNTWWRRRWRLLIKIIDSVMRKYVRGLNPNTAVYRSTTPSLHWRWLFISAHLWEWVKKNSFSGSSGVETGCSCVILLRILH